VLCRNCGSEVPEIAKFCLSCGTEIGSTTSEVAIQTPTLTPDVTASDLSVTGGATSVVASLHAEMGSTQSAASAHDVPYARFLLHSLGFALCISVIAFEIADSSAHGHWRLSTTLVVAAVLAMVFLLLAHRHWARIKKSAFDDAVYRRKLLSRSVIFTLLFVITAAIVGGAIGKSGRETGEMVADLREMSRIDARISQARNEAARTVPAQIEMYKSIETDVAEFDAVLHRLQTELAVYDAKFPELHDQTVKSIRTIEVAIRRVIILNEQITVAREIAPLDPAAQWAAWRGRMQPLRNAENALDKN